MEKAMAPHSSTLAWKNPWTEEPGRLRSMGLRSWTRLSNFPFTFHFHALEKEMATHSSVLAWRIPGTGKSGGLPSVGSHRVGHDWSELAAAASPTKRRTHGYMMVIWMLKEVILSSWVWCQEYWLLPDIFTGLGKIRLKTVKGKDRY